MASNRNRKAPLRRRHGVNNADLRMFRDISMGIWLKHLPKMEALISEVTQDLDSKTRKRFLLMAVKNEAECSLVDFVKAYVYQALILPKNEIKMSRKLKHWGGWLHHGSHQRRTVVAATTKKRALELLALIDHGRPYSVSHFNNYWSETGNSNELSVATEEGVWIGRSSRDTGCPSLEDYVKQKI